MIHEKELSIVEVNERRDKLIDVSVTDALQQKVRKVFGVKNMLQRFFENI